MTQGIEVSQEIRDQYERRIAARARYTIPLDVSKFEEHLTPYDYDEGGLAVYAVSEIDVLKFLIDEMNAAGVDITMTHHDFEPGVKYRGGEIGYFGINIQWMDSTHKALVQGMTEVANLLNEAENIQSWTEYQNAEYSLHIEED